MLFFTTIVSDNDLTKKEVESIMVKNFEEMLLGGSQVLYSLLSENFIDLFNILKYRFI